MKHTNEIAEELEYCAKLIRNPHAHPEVIGRFEPDTDNITSYLKIQALIIARSGEYHAAGVLLWASADWSANASAVIHALTAAAESISARAA